MSLYNKHFGSALADLYTFAGILAVVEGYDEVIMPYTNEYGSGKNAAEIAKIVTANFPQMDILA